MLNGWEWIQIGFSVAVFFLAIFGDRPARSAIGLIPAILPIVVLQLAFVTPHIASLAREVDEIPVSELLSSVPGDRLAAFSSAFRTGEREVEAGTVNIADAAAISEVRVRRRGSSQAHRSLNG